MSKLVPELFRMILDQFRLVPELFRIILDQSKNP